MPLEGAVCGAPSGLCQVALRATPGSDIPLARRQGGTGPDANEGPRDPSTRAP